MTPEEQKLIRMAEEIRLFFRRQGPEAAAKAAAEHIRQFWAPSMRQDFLALGDSADLSPEAKAIAEALSALD